MCLFRFRGHEHPSAVFQLIFDMRPLRLVYVATLLLPTLLQDEETYRIDRTFVICNFVFESSDTFYIRHNIGTVQDECVKRMLQQFVLPRPDRCKIKISYHFVAHRAYTRLSTMQYLSECRINDFVNKKFINIVMSRILL